MTNILIVDDSPPIRTLVNVALGKIEGVSVIEANDAAQAIEILESNTDISIMITDIVMPGMNGWELIKYVRGKKTNDDLFILVLTSENISKNSEEYIESGADDILLKPFMSTTLQMKVRDILCLKKNNG